MFKVSPLQRPLRRIVPIAIIIVGLILISALVIQQVSAQESRTLKPPFKLIQPDRTNPLVNIQPLPLTAPIVVSETFGSSFVPASSLAGTGWHTVNFSGALQGYSWGRVSVSGLMTDTAWIAKEYFPSSLPALVPGQPYTVNMNSLLIYGPVNFSDYGSIVVSATYFLDVQPEDAYGLAYSIDGTNFTIVSDEKGRDPTLGTQRTTGYSLPGAARQNTVWLAFYFTSASHPIDALGVFLDEVVVRAVPLSKNYLPVVSNVYPIPTHTPTPTATPTATPGPSNYRYLYTFTSETGGNNPDFNRWGGDRSTNCGSNCTYFQALVGNYGNPKPAFTLWQQGLNGAGGAGPRQSSTSLSTATNFEYSADVYVYNGQLDARYGLVFDASSGTFPGSGEPPMDPAVNYYLLEMRMDTSTRTKVAKWQFLRVVNGAREGLMTAATLPVSIDQGQWHNLKVVQQGKVLSFYLNGQLLGTGNWYATDWGDSRRRFGLYIDVRGSNGDNGPFEYFSDNIIVRDLP
jgi:hypothetical protein